MGRWEPDGRARLRDAALELFLERGFDDTTVSGIAERRAQIGVFELLNAAVGKTGCRNTPAYGIPAASATW